MYHIDLERDEILIRYQQNDFYHKELPRDLILPETLSQQLFLGLPLTGLQINQVKRLLVKYKDKKRFYHLLEKLSKEQRDLIFLLVEKEQLEVYRNLEDDIPLNSSEMDGLELSLEIKEFIELGLPLLERQHEFIEKQKKERVLNSLSPEQQFFLERFSCGEKEELLYKIRKGYNTVNWDISDLNLDMDINKQIELKLPLLRRQRDILDVARLEVMKRKLNKREELTFSLIMSRHLGTLQKVRLKEDKIPSGLQGDWEIIQELVRELKKGEDFDYRTFKLFLSNLIIPLKIEKDNFL